MFRRPGVIALIPARAGSKRMVGKNIRPLAGHPLIAYTIAAALESAIFTAIVVSLPTPSRSRRSHATMGPRCHFCGQPNLPATFLQTSSGWSTR